MKIFFQIIIILYASIGIIDIIAYYSTIKDLYMKRPSANINSYLVWTITTGITFLYRLFILPDFLFRIVSGIHFILSFTILFLRIKIKKKDLNDIWLNI